MAVNDPDPTPAVQDRPSPVLLCTALQLVSCRYIVYFVQTAHQTMAACLKTPDTPFEYTTSRPNTLGQASIDCCREAGERFGSTPTFSAVRVGNKRPRYDDNQTVPRDAVLEVTGPQLQSGFASGETGCCCCSLNLIRLCSELLCDAVVRGLAEKELTQFADRVQTRILQTAPVTQKK